VQSEPITTKVVYSINKIDHQDISVACLPKSRVWQSNKMYGGKLYYIMVCNEMKDKKYYTVGTVLKLNIKIIERGTIYTLMIVL
jgi:hypothetical protein